MEPWRTAIVHATDGEIRNRGYDIASLMTAKTFTDTIIFCIAAGSRRPPSGGSSTPS